MTRYQGLDERLKHQVAERDQHRCRWCGVTNRGVDAHHIRYRRGAADDTLGNLILLCRAHHSFVHGTPNGAGQTITKPVAQMILYQLVDRPGLTGAALWRRLRRQWELDGRCTRHGQDRDICWDCHPVRVCVECGNDEPTEGYRVCSECLESGAGEWADAVDR